MPDRDARTNSRHGPPAGQPGPAFESILRDAFPDATVTDLSALPGNGPHTVASVRLDDGSRYVVKYATEGENSIELRRELAVTNYVRRETEIPAAEPVAFNFDHSDRPAYIVSRRATGRTLEDALASLPPHRHPQLFSNVGEMLATLHSQTSFDDPGELHPTGPASFEITATPNWPELFARRLADRVEAVQGTRFEDLAEEVWSYVSERLRDLDTDENPVLLHGDFGDGNVTYTGTEVSTVLDWERAFVAHPEYDLCRAEVRYFLNDWGRPSRLQAMFYSGYRSIRDLPSGFENRRRCYLATFFLLPLSKYPEWGPRVTDDLDGFADRLSDKVREIMH